MRLENNPKNTFKPQKKLQKRAVGGRNPLKQGLKLLERLRITVRLTVVGGRNPLKAYILCLSAIVAVCLNRVTIPSGKLCMYIPPAIKTKILIN